MAAFSLSPTIDIFEVALLGFLIALLWATASNTRSAWIAMQWGLDDPDPFIRRLAPQQFDNARGLFWVAVILTVMCLSSFFTPSPLQGTGAVLDTLVEVVWRVGLVMAAGILAQKAWAEKWTRGYAAPEKRQNGRRRVPEPAAVAAETAVVEAQTAVVEAQTVRAAGEAGGYPKGLVP